MENNHWKKLCVLVSALRKGLENTGRKKEEGIIGMVGTSNGNRAGVIFVMMLKRIQKNQRKAGLSAWKMSIT